MLAGFIYHSKQPLLRTLHQTAQVRVQSKCGFFALPPVVARGEDVANKSRFFPVAKNK